MVLFDIFVNQNVYHQAFEVRSWTLTNMRYLWSGVLGFDDLLDILDVFVRETQHTFYFICLYLYDGMFFLVIFWGFYAFFFRGHDSR